MKRFFALLLCLLLFAGLCACSADKPDSGKDKDEQQSPTEPERTDSNTDIDSNTDTDTEPEATSAPSQSAKLDPKDASLEEMTVIDNDECVIKVTGIEYDDFWGYNVKVYFENKSEDKTYMFSVEEAAVNGLDWPVFCAEEVAPGKKANEDMDFFSDELLGLVPVFTDIEVTFRVYDSEDWSADNVARQTVHLYPFGEENASVFVREAQSDDIVLADNDDITVIAISCEEDSIWGYVVKVYVVNKTDLTLMFTADDVSVNGFMCDPYWATNVAPGKMAFSSMTWSSSDFEENGIEEVEEIEMLLRAYDYNNWLSDDVYAETVTINP